MQNIKRSYLDYILKGLLLLGLVTPLIYSANLLGGVMFTKVLFFTSLIELAFVIYIFQYFKGLYRFKFTWLDWSLVIFLIVLILSTIFSQNSFVSFWGVQDRSLSLFAWIHIFLFYVMIRGIFQKFSDIRVLLRTVLIVGGIASIYVFAQALFDWRWLVPDMGDRLTGSLGNPIFTGDLLALVAILAWGVAWLAKKFSWRVLYLIIFALAVTAVFMLQARGPVLAMLIGWFVVTFGLMQQNINQSIKRASWIILAGLVIISSFVWIYRNSDFVQSIPVVNKFANISISDPTTQTRFSTWGIAIDAFVRKPILGYGLVNFEEAFQDNYKPVFEQFGAQATKFDKAHNFIFEHLATTGILGVLSYLLIFVLGFFIILKYWRRVKSKKRIMLLTIAGVLTTYIVANLTSIEHLSNVIILIIVLAILSNLLIKSSSSNTLTLKNINTSKLFISIILVVLVVYSLFQYHFKPVLANRNMYKAEFLASQKQFNQSLNFANSAILLNTFNRPYLVLQFALKTDQNVAYAEDVNAASNYLIRAIEMLDEYTIPYYSNNVIPYRVLGGINNKLATVTKDVKYITDADNAFQKSVDISPNRPLTWVEWGKLYLATDNYNEAIIKFDKAIELNNQFAEARILNSITKLYAKDYQGADIHLNWLLANKSPELKSQIYIGLIIDAYYKNHKILDVVNYLISVLEIYPNEHNTRGKLAVLYKEMGRIVDARYEIEYILNNSRDLQILNTAKEFLQTL